MRRASTQRRGLFMPRGLAEPYAILDAGLARPAALLAAAVRARRGGVRVFQLRAKLLSDAAFTRLARAVLRVLPGRLLLVNDRCDIALVAGAGGVHLGQDDLPVAVARRILGRGAVVGLSAGNAAEALRAVAQRPDYISIGPVFRTRTKGNAGHPLGPRGYTRLSKLVPPGIPRVAVGGLTPHNVSSLSSATVDAVAAASWWLGNRGWSGDVKAGCRARRKHGGQGWR